MAHGAVDGQAVRGGRKLPSWTVALSGSAHEFPEGNFEHTFDTVLAHYYIFFSGSTWTDWECMILHWNKWKAFAHFPAL